MGRWYGTLVWTVYCGGREGRKYFTIILFYKRYKIMKKTSLLQYKGKAAEVLIESITVISLPQFKPLPCNTYRIQAVTLQINGFIYIGNHGNLHGNSPLQ